MEHRAGFVNIIGNPNVGKSTLMNALVGESLSIITPKAQTTRHRIPGILNGEDYQVVFSDTPGLLNPNYKLHESMMKYVDTALEDADILLLLIEVQQETLGADILERLNQTNVPIIILINKIDQHEQQKVKETVEFWKEKLPQADFLAIAASFGFNMDAVLKMVLEKLPENPPYYPKDELTDKTMRFFVSEIIRKHIFLNYQKEIPYSCEVTIDSYKESDNIIRISAFIFVTKESQRKIILGYRGQAIKTIGTAARKEIEQFVDNRIYLDLSVKVKKDWRNNEDELKRMGYELE
ncbi:MAG: GTPase Era [Bacteroidales bacterium]|nr:GTPase Era [Bacteroidales bacterium]